MSTTKTLTEAQLKMMEAEISAGQEMAGEEETVETRLLGRKILTGELTADEAISLALKDIDAAYRVNR